MQFSIGDKVVHPMHGAGRITGVEHQELVEGFRHYYVLEIAGKGLTVFVPIRKADALGIRPAMSPTELTPVLDTLRSTPDQLPEDHKQRQNGVLEKLKTACPIQVAEAVRDLTSHKRLDHLTRADSQLLSRGRELLAAEVALATDTEVEDANGVIDAALADATVQETDQHPLGQDAVTPDEPPDAAGEQQGLLDSLRHYATEALRLRAN